MSVPRGLSDEESVAWAKLAATVTPLPGTKPVRKHVIPSPPPAVPKTPAAKPAKGPLKPQAPRKVPLPPPAPPIQAGGLDGHWDRRIKGGAVQPDFTLDLHGHTLDQAYDRLMSGLDQARAMDARVVLLITGRSRPVDPADRAERRGAIRAKILDWLAASRHADAIAAIRRAHIRHGGEGALYLMLKRRR
ncbi:SMR /MUTS family protein [Altererythrobacter epoxidivorans]|uniref:SMR /MUTS family protein n=1 Tax=Altererythrobacter epoxidivorans TaxID=361183 RepID=A0A0M4LT94_9SPHN|nr:Smr/MutS family protein [Altererythrobacter epoxidivorans]ALE15571.1 SMR /MUTS family protein [Altererythrobacter epoxidivorans]